MSWFWGLSFVFGIWFLKDVSFFLKKGFCLFKNQENVLLEEVLETLFALKECLRAGLLPPTSLWERLYQFPPPWGKTFEQVFPNIRSQGGELLPSVERFEALGAFFLELRSEAQLRSQGALFQAGVLFLFVPAFALAIFLLVPAVQDAFEIWLIGVLLAMIWVGVGVGWMFQLTEKAQWDDLSFSNRNWVLLAFCAAEELLALIRGGMSPEIAWTMVFKEGVLRNENLAEHWPIRIWNIEEKTSKSFRKTLTHILIQFGSVLRDVIHHSLFEGVPCLERLENVCASFQIELKQRLLKKLSVLNHALLKPLFLCVAPALMSQIAVVVWILCRDSW